MQSGLADHKVAAVNTIVCRVLDNTLFLLGKGECFKKKWADLAGAHRWQ